MSKFLEILESDKFVVTIEASPPKGTNVDPFLKTVEGLAGKIDAICLPDGRSAMIHLGSLGAAVLAKQKGIEPIMTLSCRDRNRLAMSADLLGAYVLGIENILCVSGDYFHFGDAVDSMPVYDLDSVQAIAMVRSLENGQDIGGNELDGNPKFCVGCVANPQANPLAPQLLKLDKKVNAGAQFVFTLNIFDFSKSEPFFDHLKNKEIKVIAGFSLVTNRELNAWQEKKLPGNPISEEIQKDLEGIEDDNEIITKAKTRLVGMIKEAKDSGLCNGVHITADDHLDLIPEILQEAGL